MTFIEFLGSAARRALVCCLGALAAAVALFAAVPAQAEVLQISATGFVQRCPCPADQTAEENAGVLVTIDSQSRFFAPVVFPKNGDRVCRFSVVYHDINANDLLRAKLVRKAATLNVNPFNPPVVMASLQSAAGTPNTVRRATTATIVNPVIATNSAFYYVELEAETFNLNFLGVQIDVRTTCP